VYSGIRDRPVAGPKRGAVGLVVVGMGMVSLLTDISSEMVSAVLPIYLTTVAGLTPLLYGTVSGLYDGVSVAVRLLGGYAADRLRRPKAVCLAGYGLSAVCKLGYHGAGSGVGSITGVIAADRAGKGIRTAPRDAIIAASVAPDALGWAFGVHRAMDTVGAALGPLAAFGVLLLVPGGFDSVFVVSFGFAVLGLAVLALLVPDVRPAAAAVRFKLRAVGSRVLWLVFGVAVALALVTVGDGFLYLILQRAAGLDVRYFPLLPLVTMLVYLALAVPFGLLADRVGRARVFIGGHLLLLGAYAVALAAPPGIPAVAGTLAMLGAYYAATDGVLAAMAAGLVAETNRATGIALVQTGVALGRLVSGVLFGLAWTATGSASGGLWIFGVGLAVVLPVVGWLFRRSELSAKDV